MRLKNYKDDLKKRLGDPEYAAEYLARVLAEKDSAAFLIVLKDVMEAGRRKPASRHAPWGLTGKEALRRRNLRA